MSLHMTGNALAEPALGVLDSSQCQSFRATGDADVPRAWHLDRLRMQSAWDIATGNGIDVAVIDTGVAATGSPFFRADRMVTLDFLNGMSDDDKLAQGIDCEHGTRVASLIGGARPGGQEVDVRTNFAGIAPDVRIISYRVLSASEAEEGKQLDSLEYTIAAVKDAILRDVDIINLSQSVSGADPLIGAYRVAVNEALAKNIVVVAAAGNATPNAPDPSYPGAFDGVISVGISTRTDTASELSLPGARVTVGAPGADLMALAPSTSLENAAHTNQSYASGLIGTSYAAPIVTGVVALMLEADPSLTPAQVRRRLEETADVPPTAIPDSRIGYGIVNPLRALTGVARPQTGNPDADVEVPVEPLPVAEEPDMVPAVIAVSVGTGALILVAVGIVAAISLPSASRRNRG